MAQSLVAFALVALCASYLLAQVWKRWKSPDVCGGCGKCGKPTAPQAIPLITLERRSKRP